MLFQVQIQPKSFKSVSVYGNCGETTQAHYMTTLYNWLMHDVIIIIIDKITSSLATFEALISLSLNDGRVIAAKEFHKLQTLYLQVMADVRNVDRKMKV